MEMHGNLTGVEAEAAMANREKLRGSVLMNEFDTTLPPALSELHQLDFDYDAGIDFEPFDAEGKPNHSFAEFAAAHAPDGRRPAKELLDAARAQFPDFEEP
jgi:hypothetical protein